MAEKLTILVTGATGQQGGALARTLLKKGHRVRALTRKPEAPSAQELKKQGAEIVKGSFDGPGSIENAAKGVDAAFAMGTPYEAGPEAEIKQGIALVEALAKAKVPFLLYTSVSDADRNTGIPHFDSKYRIEQRIKELGIRHAIVAPVFFMDNLLSPWFLPQLQQGKLALAMPAGRKLQHVAVTDLGEFNVLVLERRDQFAGKRINIASDELNGAEAAQILSRVIGRKIEYSEIPLDQLRSMNEDWAKMFEWFDKVGYSADIPGLRKQYPEVRWHTFEQWAKEQDWSAVKGTAAKA
jgi:uncharacterized protein YbjT (DUF2867 family)